MMTVRLPESLDNRLTKLAKDTHRTKSYYVKRAIEEFLKNQESGEEKLIPFEEILKKHGTH